jgi:hypothetical protein
MSDEHPPPSPRRKVVKVSQTADKDGFIIPPRRTTRKSVKKEMLAQATSTQNSFEILSDSEPEIADYSMDEDEPSKDPPLPKKARLQSDKPPKPIIVTNTTFSAVTAVINLLSLDKMPTFKKRRGKDFSIQAASVQDKKKILEKLNSQNHQLFTYTEVADRHQIFSLFGHHETSTDVLLQDLTTAGIPAVKVLRANKSVDDPIFLVTFQKNSTSLHELQTKHSVINFLRIKWDKNRPRVQRPTQCHRCQRFGHAAINCSLPFRCVKCLNTHEPGQCSRTSRDEGLPSCVKCNQEGHASNSMDCPVFIKYFQRIAAKKS